MDDRRSIRGDSTGFTPPTLPIAALAVALLAGAPQVSGGGAGVAPEVVKLSAARHFDFAIFLKPDLRNVPEITGKFAPLIVREVDSASIWARHAPLHFGGRNLQLFALPHWLEWQAKPWRRAFAYEGSIKINGLDHPQVTYIWQHAAAGDSPAMVRIGLRITIGSDGFPIVWEVLDSRQQSSILYVSRSAENLAAAQFGAPLTDRHLSIEQSFDQARDVIVVRALEDGPIPMGPYIYADAASQITSILCRCSPTQVDEFLLEKQYQVEPMTDELKALLPQTDLTKMLRWPQGL